MDYFNTNNYSKYNEELSGDSDSYTKDFFKSEHDLKSNIYKGSKVTYKSIRLG